MGNSFEMEMWAWLEKNREYAQDAYVAEVRRIVNAINFSYAETIPDFYEWCMENYKKPTPAFLHDRTMSLHRRAYTVLETLGDCTYSYGAFCSFMKALAKRDNDPELVLETTCQQIWNTAKEAIKAGMSKEQAFPLTGDKNGTRN